MGPLQQCLALPGSTRPVALIAVGTHLRGMPAKRSPALDLPNVDFPQSTAQVIPAIPLEPTSWVGTANPPFLAPDAERLSALYAEIIERGVGNISCSGVCKPTLRQLGHTVVTVFSLEHTHFKHLFWRKMGLEVGWKVARRRRFDLVTIGILHAIVHNDGITNFIHIAHPDPRSAR